MISSGNEKGKTKLLIFIDEKGIYLALNSLWETEIKYGQILFSKIE